jgi:VanZ family protein
MRRFAPALLVSVLVVAMAPFAGEIRDWIADALAEGFVGVMGAAFAVVAVAVVGWVVARIRDDRLRRYGLLLLGLALLVGQLAGWSRADARVNAVERIHFFYYGLLGFLWLRAFRQRRSDLSAPLLSLLALLVVAIADEGVQWWVAARTGEIYDVALNVYAGATGLLVALALDGPRSLVWRFEAGARSSLARTGAVALVALAAFVHVAHLGYRIEDPEVGTFRSFFSVEELRDTGRDRAARWAETPLGPPGEFAPLEVEDWFRSEAGMRVQHRNAALERGDVYQAWKENLILERWYAPFLGQLNRDGNPFRLPAETRRSLEETRPKRDPYPYDSPVGRVPLRIWLWPTKSLLWTTASAAVVLFLAGSALAARRM